MAEIPYPRRGSEHLELWLQKLVSPTFVYVIQGDPGTAIKVGFAKDVMARIAGLQTGNPMELRLLHVFPAEQRLERFFHKRLAAARHRGEWFQAGEVVDDFLCWAAYLADWMVKEHNGSAWPPDYRGFDPDVFGVPYVPPTPSAVDPKAEKIRRYARGGLRPYEYLNPDGTLKDLEPAPQRANLPPILRTPQQEETLRIIEGWKRTSQ